MPMKMGWRWYGEGNDPVTLSDIKQIPGVTSIVWALHNKMPGEIWEIDEIQKVADQIHAYGFDMDVVESVNVHDDIKIGLPTRDQYIENYIHIAGLSSSDEHFTKETASFLILQTVNGEDLRSTGRHDSGRSTARNAWCAAYAQRIVRRSASR